MLPNVLGLVTTIVVSLVAGFLLDTDWFLAIPVGVAWGIAVGIMAYLVKIKWPPKSKKIVDGFSGALTFVMVFISNLALLYFKDKIPFKSYLALSLLIYGMVITGYEMGLLHSYRINQEQKSQ